MGIISYIATHWIEWLFAIITAIVGLGYRRVSQRLLEERERNKAIAIGVQSLLRENIVRNYNKYHDKGYCPIYAKESVKRLYEAYHELGGNDVATSLYQKILQMPEEDTNPDE